MHPTLPLMSADTDSTLNCYAMDSDDSHSCSPFSNRPASSLSNRPVSWIRTDSSPSDGSTFFSSLSASSSHTSSSQLSPASTDADVAVPPAADSDDCARMASRELSATSALTGSSTSPSVPTPGDASTLPLPLLPDMGVDGMDSDRHCSMHFDAAMPPHALSSNGDETHWNQRNRDGDGNVNPAADDHDNMAFLKLEPLDQVGCCLDALQEAPVPSDAGPSDARALVPAMPKRPRGRPRKLSGAPASSATAKINTGRPRRSRTGCTTCRKRKKKCDETKPRCVNCEKNAIVCEGYPEKQVWRSGRQKAEEERLKTQNLMVISMPPIFDGLETEEDRVFLRHYNDRLASVFTVESKLTTAFKDIFVPLATTYPGMMHAILSLASIHFNHEASYAERELNRNPKVTAASLRSRGRQHRDEASKSLYNGMGSDLRWGPYDNDTLHVRYGQMLLLILQSLAEGQIDQELCSHYQAFHFHIQKSPPQDPTFCSFITELSYYHICADELLRFPSPMSPRIVTTNWTLASPIHSPRLLGVADGLFYILAQITALRDDIRARVQTNIDPPVGYGSLYNASCIESRLRDWNPEWPVGDSRERVSLVYKLMAWLYLKTTICLPVSMCASQAQASEMVDPRTSGPILDPPPHPTTATTSGAAISPLPKEESPRTHHYGGVHGIGGVGYDGFGDMNNADGTGERRPSPAPIRRPPNYEPDVSTTVKASLMLLEGVEPQDPAQTLLLLPCFIVGTACDAPAERERVRKAIHGVHEYTGLRNTDTALMVLEELWRLMDVGAYWNVWDWQMVANGLGVHHMF